MNQLFLVALGGAIGSVLRFKLSGFILYRTLDWKFPLNTFTVNVLGCLLIGVLAGLAEKEKFFTSEMRVLLFTGLIGGFTTFSAFGLETLYLIRDDNLALAAVYVLLSILVGLIVMYVGFEASQL